MKKTKPKKTFTITEAAKELGLTRQGVHWAIDNGLLKAKLGKIVQTRVSHGYLITPKSIESYRKKIKGK